MNEPWCSSRSVRTHNQARARVVHSGRTSRELQSTTLAADRASIQAPAGRMRAVPGSPPTTSCLSQSLITSTAGGERPDSSISAAAAPAGARQEKVISLKQAVAVCIAVHTDIRTFGGDRDEIEPAVQNAMHA
jgi:hypothetical protein